MKFWAWDEKNLPSITHAIRTAVAATVSVLIARLVQMPEAYWAAIATLVVMQSTRRDADALARADRRHRHRRISGSARGEFSRCKFDCVRRCDRSDRITVDRVSFGEDRVSLRQHYPRHHCSNPAFGSGVDHRAAPIP
jgi:hypothetical protein